MKKILVIEDDQDIAEIVEMALEDRYLVKVEMENSHVLEAFDNFMPDVIMVDNQLGQRRAKDIVSEIKNITAYKTIPFVLFSGHQDIERLAQEIDASAYLSKPFALADLYSCLDDVLSNCA